MFYNARNCVLTWQVRWIRVLYSDFEVFTRDQEYLISKSDRGHSFDYIEGFVILGNGDLLNNWRSSMFTPQNPVNVSTLSTKGRVLYCLELTKNYNQNERVNVGQVGNAIDSKKHCHPFLKTSFIFR